MRMCGQCGEVDYSVAYLTNPPQYKCERYGCIISADDCCKGESNAEKQEQGQAAQQPI